MTKDGTLAILEKAYVNNYGLNEQPKACSFLSRIMLGTSFT